MKALRFLLTILLAAFFSITVFAGASQEGEAGEKSDTVKISYWVRPGPEWEEYGQYIVDNFLEGHPNIELDLRAMPESDQAGANPFMIAIATGTMANVTDGNNAAVQDMALNGGLVELTRFPDFQAELNKILEGIRYWCTMVGPDGERHYYQLANNGTSFMSAFNAKLVREAGLDVNNPPKTFDEYLVWSEAMTKDTDGDGTIDQWGTVLPTDDVGWHLNPALFFLYQSTGVPDLVSKDRKHSFITDFPEESKLWLQFSKTIYQNEWAPHEELAGDAFGLGKVGMNILALAGNIPNWKRDFPDLEYGFFSHPKPAGAEGITLGQAGGNVIWLMNSKSEAQINASWELLKFMNRPEVVRYQLQTRGGIPGVQGVTLGEEFADLEPFIKELEKSNSLINYTPEYFKVRNIFVVEYNKAIRGRISIEEALQNTVEKVGRIFE